MEVIATGEEVGNKIGNPKQLEIKPIDPSATKKEHASFGANSMSTTASINSNTSLINGTNLNSQVTHPISSLSPYHNR